MGMAASIHSMENRKEKTSQYVPKVGRDILNAFEELVPRDQDTQANATIKILKHVEAQIQQQTTNDKDDLGGDVQYIIVRLVRGLASDREHARHGFYTTLQMMLQLFPQTLSFVVTNMKKNYEKQATTELDGMVGEALGWGAIIRSGRLKEESELQDRVANRLLSVREKKSYLGVITTQFLVNMIETCNGIGSSEKVWTKLEKQLATEIKEPSDLWLKLVLARKQVQSVPKWLSEYKITEDLYFDIGGIIMQTAPDVSKVHPVVGEVIRHLASQNTKENEVLASFWSTAIIPRIKNFGSEQQRGFIIAKLILSEMKTKEEVEKLLSPRLIKSLMYTVGRKDPESLAVTQTLTDSILQVITENKENSDLQTAVVSALIIKPGSVRFDKLTGTRLLQQACEHLSAGAIKVLANQLLHIVKNLKSDQAEWLFSVAWLGRLTTHPNVMVSECVSWRGKTISAIMKAAFFSQTHPKQLQAANDSFFRCLNHPTKQLNDFLALLQKMFDISNELLAAPDTPKHKLLGKEATRNWKHIQDMLTKLKSEEKSLEDQLKKIFQVLYYQMGIQLFSDPSGAKEMVAELDQCFKNATKSFTKAKEETVDTKEPGWLEVIVDLLVSLLSKDNQYWRTVVKVVFRLLCPYMTASALAIITDVLNPEKQDEIIIKEGEEEHQQGEGEDLQEEEEEDDASDEEDDEGNNEAEEESDEEEEDVEESEDESEDDDVTENEENIFEIQKKMLGVLGDVDTEVDMDSVPDSEFRSIDKKLGALLGQYLGTQKKKNKKGLAEDEIAMMHFRTRVCDLLDVYVKEAESMSLMIGLVVPLLNIVRSINSDKRQEAIQNRLRTVLTQLAKVKKFKSTEGVSVKNVVDELEKLFQTTEHMPQSLSDMVGGCYSLLHNCGHQLLGEDAHKLDNPMITVYRKHLEAFFSQKSMSKSNGLSIQAYISPLLSANGGMWSIASLLINHAFNDQTRLFRRTQALHLLLRLYQNSSVLAIVKEEEMVSIEQEINEKSHSYISSLQQPSDVKVEYLSNMLELLRAIHLYHAKSDGMNWEKLTEVLVIFRQRVAMRTIKPVNAPYQRLAHALKFPQLPKTSELSEEEKKKAKAEKKRKRAIKEEKYGNKNKIKGNVEGKVDNEKENNSTEKTNELINSLETDKKTDDKKNDKKESKTKKKRKTDAFYENRKLCMRTKTIADLDVFNFAQAVQIGEEYMEVETKIDNPINTQGGKVKKNKKSKGKKVKKDLNQAPIKKRNKEKKDKNKE